MKKKPNKVSVKGTVGLMKGLPEYNRPQKLKGWFKYKSYRDGYNAGKAGDSKTTCPYQLTPELITLLLKRDRWLRGHEDWTFGPIQHKRNLKDMKKMHRRKKKKHRERD